MYKTENRISEPLDAMIVDILDDWATRTPKRVAAEWQGDTITYAELRTASLHVSRALLSSGVGPRHRVPLLTQMSLEMLPAIIGILRVGACFAPMDVAAWSRSRVVAALNDISAHVALITSTIPGIQLPTVTVNFQDSWLRRPLENAKELCAKLDAIRNGLRADDLAWIIFTSGTTGKPKGVVVPHRGIYPLAMAFPHIDDLEAAAEKQARCLLVASVAFDGCQANIWGTFRKGRTLVMASPSHFPEVAATCDVLTLTPSMLATLDPSGPYDRVRYIFLGAEAPSLATVRQWICPTRKVINTYGPSETTCIISMGELSPDEEPTFGDIMPGVRVVLVDDNLRECQCGEVMIAGPGLAAGYLNNPDLTGKKFIEWNGERFYRTGDLARRTENGKLVFAGRMDSLVKNRGFLVNLETEVEPALQSFPAVRAAVAFKWQERLIGCVQPATVDIEQLRLFMRERCDPFVVPDDILALDSFPVNVNGKTDRHALKNMMDERTSRNDEAYIKHEIRDGYYVLRLGFAKILHVAFKDLGRDSSFTRLGGHSLAAIRLSNLLKQQGYSVVAVQILRLDTIGRLEENLKRLSDLNVSEHDNDEAPAPATDVQRFFLMRSLQNPQFPALVGTSKYVGDPHATPTATELRAAIFKACSAHSIFQTRFDLTTFTLSDLGRLNLDWREISVPEDEFEAACEAVEDQFWQDVYETTKTEVEVPYCHATCVSVPERKAVAMITRINHVLTDVFSTALIWQDVERALAGEEIREGPQIQDFARFMHRYKQEHLERAIHSFEAMMKPLPAASVLQLPSPRKSITEKGLGLVRLDSPVAVSKPALDSAARSHGVTTTTMVYAAWALFLSRVTSWDCVGFSVSVSGRTVPWPGAQSIIGPLLGRGLFCTLVPASNTVHDWLAKVHTITLNLLEFDGLTNGLPASLIADSRTNTTNVLCFLDMPSPSTNWIYKDKQGHNYLMSWYIFPNGDGLKTEFEVQSQQVDLDWAKEVASMPGRLLDGLANAKNETLLEDLLR